MSALPTESRAAARVPADARPARAAAARPAALTRVGPPPALAEAPASPIVSAAGSLAAASLLRGSHLLLTALALTTAVACLIVAVLEPSWALRMQTIGILATIVAAMLARPAALVRSFRAFFGRSG